MKNLPKYPSEYNKPQIGEMMNPFRLEFKFDSRGRLIMPLPGYSKFMLSVEPGSKNITQGTESEAGTPQTDPGSFDSGYIYSGTALRFGPKGGWVTQLSGGDYEFPLSYFNEITNVMNFYVDKSGNVYLKGTIIAEAGGLIAGWTIGSDELYKEVTAGGVTYRIGLKPTAWPFYAYAPVVGGVVQYTSAIFRVNPQGGVYCTNLTILGGTGVANLADAGNLAVKDAVDLSTAEVLNRYLDNILDGTIYGRIKKTGLTSEGFIALDAVVDGTTYKKVKAVMIDANGMVLLDQTVDGTYSKVLATQISAGKIYLSEASTYKVGYDPSGKRRVFTATPTTPYDVGDLWLDASTVKRCTTARATGAYVATDWTATTLDAILDGSAYSRVLTTDISAGHVKLDSLEEGTTYKRVLATHISAGKIYIFSDTQFAAGYNPTEKENQVYKQSTAPLSPATGTLWIDTSVSPNLWKRWSGTTWVKATPQSADINALLTINAPAEAGADVTAGKSLSVLTDRTLTFIADVADRKAVSANEKTGASLGYDILFSKLTAYGLVIWTANSTTRVELTASGLSGYNAGVLQVEIKASDGKIYAGAGAVILDAVGIRGYSAGVERFRLVADRLNFYDASGNLHGIIDSTTDGLKITSNFDNKYIQLFTRNVSGVLGVRVSVYATNTIFYGHVNPGAGGPWNLGAPLTGGGWDKLILANTGRILTTGRASYPAMILTEIGTDYTKASCRMDIVPDINNQGALGYSTNKWNTVERVNEGACDLPTSNSAIDIFKKISKPIIQKGVYGERHYFKKDQFPDEMKFLNDKGELDIELTRIQGVTVQAVRELIEKVEDLETKIK